MVWCLPTGAYDPRKHADYEGCARAEMSEEAQLEGGTWVPLMPEGHPGIPEVKWCRCGYCVGGRPLARLLRRLLLPCPAQLLASLERRAKAWLPKDTGAWWACWRPLASGGALAAARSGLPDPCICPSVDLVGTGSMLTW